MIDAEQIEDYQPIPSTTRFFTNRTGRIMAIDKKTGRLKAINTRLNKGYLVFNAGMKGRPRRSITKKVHRCIAEAFLGQAPFRGAHVRHLNDIKTDNRLENLAWGSPQDNTNDAIRNGKFSFAVVGAGEDHFNAKLTENDVLDIRALLAFGARNCDIASSYGISRSNVTIIAKRKIWNNI